MMTSKLALTALLKIAFAFVIMVQRSTFFFSFKTFQRKIFKRMHQNFAFLTNDWFEI
jgi:hypothetical protein